ncbi:MAG TPA: hypothetical protein VN226_01590 [Anaerolineales bacterium]|nr:hypothetical protein [Anaerolineales bacterium]
MPRFLNFLILSFLISACSLPIQNISTLPPQAWFDMPLPNTILQPGDPCQIIAHGASLSGIKAFELSLNQTVGQEISIADPQATLAKLEIECGFLKPGKNILSVRAQDSTGVWSAVTNTTVFLEGLPTFTRQNPILATASPIPDLTSTMTLEPELIATFTPTLLTSTSTPTLTSTLTSTLTPTDTSTVPPAGSATVERVSVNTVFLGASSCGPNEVTILVKATAPAGIRVVLLFYRFVAEGSSAPFENIDMNPIGGDLYQITLNPSILLGGVPFENGRMQYQVVVQQNDGDTSIRTPVLSDIVLQSCGSVTPSCSSYSDERTCIANGCAWVAEPGLVPIFSCKKP